MTRDATARLRVPLERDDLLDEIEDVVREAWRLDWARWELEDIARSAARDRGVRLTADEVAAMVGSVARVVAI